MPLSKQEPADKCSEGGSEVFQVVRVQQRVPHRVQMGQDYAEVEEELTDTAVRAKGLHTVDSVQGEPTDDEEDDYSGEILGGLDLPLLSGTQ